MRAFEEYLSPYRILFPHSENEKPNTFGGNTDYELRKLHLTEQCNLMELVSFVLYS